MDRPLDRTRIEERLEELVEAVLSSRRTATGPAERLARLDLDTQTFVLGWVSVIARTNQEMAYQVAAYAAEASERLDVEGLEAWIVGAMDAFDERGLVGGVAAVREIDAFTRARESRLTGAALDDFAGVLVKFLQGLDGRTLRIAAASEPYTDTGTIHLPPLVSLFRERSENFAVYKAIAGHHWAQVRFGTWRIDVGLALSQFTDRGRALEWFRALESIRLDGCLSRALPGLHRDMQALSRRIDGDAGGWEWRRLTGDLAAPGTGAGDSLALVSRLCHETPPPRRCYEGALKPDAVRALMTERIARERTEFRNLAVALAQELAGARRMDDGDAANDTEPREALRRLRIESAPDAEGLGADLRLRFDDRPAPIPDDVKGVAESIVQDLGKIPPDYLEAAGPGRYSAESGRNTKNPEDVWKGVYHEEGAFFYNEWDFERKHYRKDWCVLRERDVHPVWDNFVDRTLDRHAGLLKSIRRTFEALRGEEKRLRRQPDGDEIDLDALVEAFAGACNGHEYGDRLFTRMDKHDRDIAVMFMVDMSGSTKGWINDAEREALVLLCEALETLGDRYAVYGFSGSTRKRCEIYRIKRFDEPYGDLVQARISGIQPQDYTRMGAAIRHLARITGEIDARTKVLVTLSDGKPDDYTDYRGAYGIEDTRQALLEARRDGIHPFCVTIDDEAGDYLPHMYGAVNFTMVDDVRKLPYKLSDIYRKLTT